MQVDRKPSRWPMLVTLVYLLLLCLLVPRYWHSRAKLDARQRAIDSQTAESDRKEKTPLRYVNPPLATARTNRASNLVLGDYSPSVRTEVLSNDVRGRVHPLPEVLLRRLAPGSIEEFLASLDFHLGRVWTGERDFLDLTGPVRPNLVGDLPKLNWQVFENTSSVVAADDLGSTLLAALRSVGRGVGQWNNHRAGRLLLWAVIGPNSSSVAATNALTSPEVAATTGPLDVDGLLRLHDPNDRLAMVPRIMRRHPTRRTIAPQLAAPGYDSQTVVERPWSAPKALFDQLQTLSQHPYSADWAVDAIAQLQALTERDRLDRDEAESMLARLENTSASAVELADASSDEVMSAELLRAHWGLERRHACWEQMLPIASRSTAQRRMAMRESVGSSYGGQAGQAVETVELRRLSDSLESYEQSPEPPVARTILAMQQQLRATNDPQDAALADAVEMHYRNANVRVAVTDDLLNRFVDQSRAEWRPVHERIAGTPVRGRSETVTESRVELQPDAARWWIGLEADGTVDSITHSEGSPAVVRTHGTTNFLARKSIFVDASGVQLGTACVDADSRNWLLGVTSQYDWIPFLGSYIRSRAVEQYRMKRPRAQAEVEYKVAHQARERMDERTGRAVQKLEHQVSDRLFRPLRDHGVKLTPIALSTTDERVVARLRLAGEMQLGAHTPRPRAPADSRASIQVHESALVNAAIALELNGARLTAVELRKLMSDMFPQLADLRPAEELKEGTIFHFADQDAVQFHFKDGKVELTLAMKEFTHDGQTARNFNVHAIYRPEINGMQAELVRDETLGIEGRLGASDRARLHNVFNEVLPVERRLPIVKLDDPDDPRLAGLTITQLVLEDGWLGLAIGPEADGRTAQRVRTFR